MRRRKELEDKQNNKEIWLGAAAERVKEKKQVSLLTIVYLCEYMSWLNVLLSLLITYASNPTSV